MVYIQANSEKTLPHHFDCACALYGAMENVWDYKLVTFEEVHSGKFDNLIRTNLFVGSVEFMREVFNRVGVQDPRVPMNSPRKHEILTLEEAHKRVANGETLFVKPYEIKLFTGLILDGCQYSCLETLPQDTKVMVYEPFNHRIESEWRIYIRDGRIEDARNYSGDVLIVPSRDYINSVIESHCVDFPRAYTIDVAVLSNGMHEVVEFNDMWAIGNYGIPNDIYISMLKARYFELIKTRYEN